MAEDRDLRAYEEDQLNVSIPGPLNARLDALVELANKAGENTNRREVVSALILASAEDGEELSAAVRAFRRAGAEDAAVAGFEKDRFVNPAKRPPGPRPRKKS